MIIVLYFYSVGALRDFWTWTVTYNYSVYGPEGAKNLSDQLIHIWRVIWRVLGINVVFIAIGLAGLLMFTVERAAARLKGREALRSPDLFKDALLIAPVVYSIFCLIDFQAGPDLIPLFPFIGIFAAWFVVKTGRSIKNSEILMQTGKDTYVAAEKYGGSFEAIVDEIESQRPRLVALSRLRNVSLRAELERWVAEHYDKLEGYNDTVYLRRPGTASFFPRIWERRHPCPRLIRMNIQAHLANG